MLHLLLFLSISILPLLWSARQWRSKRRGRCYVAWLFFCVVTFECRQCLFSVTLLNCSYWQICLMDSIHFDTMHFCCFSLWSFKHHFLCCLLPREESSDYKPVSLKVTSSDHVKKDRKDSDTKVPQKTSVDAKKERLASHSPQKGFVRFQTKTC